MLIFDREYRRYHGFWCLGIVLATVAALAWYGIYGFGTGSWNWPGGASPPGFAFGVLGGVIILFEMLLWPRKSWWRGWRLGRTKWWMTAHIWLGLLALPLLLLHGACHFDLTYSTLAAVLSWLLVIVVGSGSLGLVIQNIVPRLMLEDVPAETIHSQIGHILGQHREEAERLVAVTCGRSPAGEAGAGGVPERSSNDPSSYVSVATVRQVGRVQGKVVQAGIEAVWVPDSEALLKFYQDQIEPYLEAKSGPKLPLGSPPQAAALFRNLKTRLRVEAHPVVDRLAGLCDQRRQFAVQARLHTWLHAWLGVHVALSVALVLLMLVHIVLALKYV
ncbi:MAG: hypothetical protein ACHRXM_21725 [Isosphaerales bacterium]